MPITYKVVIDDYGNTIWYQNGKCHRLDGPAVEYADGYRAWYQNGRCHRLDGPAAEYADGYRAWFLDGKRHRIDGPAIESVNGYKAWYLDGIEYSEAEYNKEITKRNQPETLELTVADIEKLLGKKVKIIKRK